ncbi:MAG: GAF domain-containing protein [Gemmatimonadales bacterium]|jgi:GAF domain-containing protein
MTGDTVPQSADELETLRARVTELERERKHLLAVIEILEEISSTLHVVDVLQGITRKLGESFGLDRCSIFLADPGERKARLVASYEDPSIRNFVVDLDRYPELERALRSGETVFIADAQADDDLKHIKGVLKDRRVQSITVVPITWRGTSVGAIFLRTFRDGPSFSDADVRFTQVVASLAAKALRNAHRYEQLLERSAEPDERTRQDELRRIALLGFLTRLFQRYDEQALQAEEVLAKSAGEELDRLVEIALAVFAEESKGG